ncbi:hypothetical protein [Neobacillus sp. PS3-40]|uniref:hypothetical protein n=1 Tax=Neobacillus sp. PS3-40 TaxID=3070679 RepID=UPI0027E189DE|nr:hypothetical protein [Neobacillus sp. PS3-40]WML46148.1 hypothetical protein RCG20_09765 [Neobacillus sp. PS3-40]
MYSVKLMKPLLNVKEEIISLKNSETTKKLLLKVLLLSLIGAILTALTVYFSSDLEMQIRKTGETDIEKYKLITSAVTGILGLFIPIVTITLFTIFSWIFFQELSFKKLFIVQTYSYVIGVVGQLGQVLIMFSLGVDSLYSPFGLASLSQSLFDSKYINSLMNCFTIFSVWSVVFQIISLKYLSTRSKKNIITVVILLNAVSWILLAAWS